MTSERAPAFQFYPKDFLSDSNQAAMSLQEVGAYIRLLCVCWNDGSLPSEVDRLARIVGTTTGQMSKLWPAIRQCFREHPTDAGRMVHPRLEKERVKQDNYRRRQSDAAAKRWDKLADATALPRHSHGNATAMPAQHTRGNALLSSSSTPVVAIAKNAIATASARGVNPSDFQPETLSRVGGFIERYKELYVELRKGAHYLSHPQKDFPEAALLCDTYDDDRLDKLARVFLTTDHEFAEKGSRTLAQFRSMASWCDSRLRERGL